MGEEYDLGIPHPIKPYQKLIINAAITGMVPTKKDNPHVPVSVDEIIEDAINCYRAGASILHIHARDNDQKPTYKKEIYAQIIEGIRSQCADVIICTTTSGRVDNTFEKRSQVLEFSLYEPEFSTFSSLQLDRKLYKCAQLIQFRFCSSHHRLPQPVGFREPRQHTPQ